MGVLRNLRRDKTGVYDSGKCKSCGNDLTLFSTHGHADISGHDKGCVDIGKTRRGAKHV